MTHLAKYHLLVTMLIDVYSAAKAPTLADALRLGKPRHVFMSTERLEPCPNIRSSELVSHLVHLDFIPEKPVILTYNTSLIVCDTGRMTLQEGYKRGYRQAIIGLLHDRGEDFEIEPIVIGAPWLDHERNESGDQAVWLGYDYGEIVPEDIEQFSAMKSITASDSEEWMSVMKTVPEQHVKSEIAKLLSEPRKADWGNRKSVV